MRRLRLAGITIALVCMTSAVVAASASALPVEFRAESYPVVEKSVNTNIHGFSVEGGKLISLCEEAHFNTGEGTAKNPTADSSTIIVHPTYGKCHISVLGLGNSTATISTAGCNYKLFAKTEKTTGGEVKVECEAGKEITVTDDTVPACGTSVGSQALKGVEYINEPGAPTFGKTKVNSEVEGIKWKATAGCKIGLAGTDGIYRQGKLTGGIISEIEPAGKPATVNTTGETEAAAPDNVVVDAIPPHYYKNSLGEGGKLAEGEKLNLISWGTLTLETTITEPPGPKLKPITCENAGGGNVENPIGGGAGVGETKQFATFNCKWEECPPGKQVIEGKEFEKQPVVFALGTVGAPNEKILFGSFPWPSVLTEPAAKVIKSQTKKATFLFSCIGEKSTESAATSNDGIADADGPAFVGPVFACFVEDGGAIPPVFKTEATTKNGTQIGGPLTSELLFKGGESGTLGCVKKKEHSEVTEAKGIGFLTGSLQVMTYEGQELVLDK